VGAKQKVQLREDLVAQGIDADIVGFALSNPMEAELAPGANRNAFLLLSVGDLVLSVDDDTVCSLVFPQASRDLALSSAYNPMALSFYADREKLLASVPFGQMDFVGSHAHALGRTIPDFLSQFRSFSDACVTTITHDLMKDLEKGIGT